MLPTEMTEGYPCAVLFGKALSRECIRSLRAGLALKHQVMNNAELKMDALAVKVTGWLEVDGYQGVGKHKATNCTQVSRAAGWTWLYRKNNLLVTECTVLRCCGERYWPPRHWSRGVNRRKRRNVGKCGSCVDVCPTETLLGTPWAVIATREEMMIRKRCIMCLKCMVSCPYTEMYALEQGA